MDSLRDVIAQHCQLQEGPCPRRRPCTGGKCQRRPATDDAINEFEQADEDSPSWHLDGTKINDLQQQSIAELVKRCKASHFVDVHVRINGKWEVYQADWLKHLASEQAAAVAAEEQDKPSAVCTSLPAPDAGWRDDALPIDRETLGRMVREAWVRWAKTQPNPKPSWLLPYDELSEPDKEADRQIGEAICRWTVIHYEARAALTQEAGEVSLSQTAQALKSIGAELRKLHAAQEMSGKDIWNIGYQKAMDDALGIIGAALSLPAPDGSSAAGAAPIDPAAEAPLRKRPIAWMRYVCGSSQFKHASDAGDPPEDQGWIALYRRNQP